MIELKDKRSYTAKTFDNGNGTFKLQAHVGHIHYNNKLKIGDGVEGMRSIDMTLVWDDTKRGWGFNMHNFNPFIPEYADEWADFRDLFDDKDQTISYKPRCSHVLGRLVPSVDGVTESNAVIYDNAYGEGFDLIYYFKRSEMLKVVRIRDGFKPTTDVSFDFHVKFSDPTMKVLRSFENGDEYELDITKPKTFDKARKTKIEKRGLIKNPKKVYNTYLKEFKVWDDGGDTPDKPKKEQVINVDLMHDAEGVFLRKNIPATFLAESIGSVYTDTVTGYYSGTGDGYIWESDADWATCRNSTNADGADYTATGGATRAIFYGGATYYIQRGFLPIDTSGLPDGATISDATLDLYTNYGESGFTLELAEGTQASTTTLATTDFDNVGSTSFGSVSWSTVAGTKNVITLNASGIAHINDTGWTKFALRDTEDLNNTAPTSGNNECGWRTSNYGGTASDPYLEVTYTTGGAPQNSNFLAFM